MNIKTCVTTNKVLSNNFVKFSCPNCNEKIVRSLEARAKGLEYTCKSCGFTGP